MRNVDPDAISDEELVAQIHMVYSSNKVTGTNLEEIRRLTGDDHMLSELGEKIQNG